MAVETAHHTLFPPQLLLNNQMTMMDTIDKQSNASIYKNHLGYGMVHPLSGTTTAETLLPMYSGFTDSINPDQLKADSGLTYTLPVSRKRSRESSSMCPFNNAQNVNRCPIDCRASCTGETVTFLGEDISSQIQRQQLEVDQFVALHTETLRADIEERRKKHSGTIMAALEEGIAQRLRAKEEQVMKMAKWNWALEEKLKSLSIENQIWRELAQTNEATANALRSNLKQVLDQVINNDYRHHCSTTAGEEDTTVLVDDAQSCCESNNENERTLAEQDSCSSHSNGNMSNRLCKNCGKAESCVLLLPCRHLCLCTVCASSVNICPTCKSTKTISVHVHMS